jgi:hypothetical protein
MCNKIMLTATTHKALAVANKMASEHKIALLICCEATQA